MSFPIFYRKVSTINHLTLYNTCRNFTSAKNDLEVEQSTDPDTFSTETTEVDSVEGLKSKIDELEQKLAAAEEKLSEYKNKLLRSLAECENTRTRYIKEVEKAQHYGITNFAKSILDVADSLELATKSIDINTLEKGTELANVVDGINLTIEVLNSKLNNFGIQRIEALGEIFDPQKHEALFEVQDASKPKGTVSQVLQPGYVIKDRILRAAKVGVVVSTG